LLGIFKTKCIVKKYIFKIIMMYLQKELKLKQIETLNRFIKKLDRGNSISQANNQ